jgi:altronate dehydratase large subunit
MKFLGYPRPKGKVGIRNHVLIMPSVVCANLAVRGIARNVAGSVYFEHQHGCGQLGADAELTKQVLVGHGTHPNVFGVVVVGLGCEIVGAQMIADEIRQRCPGKPVECVIIQDEGGTSSAVAQGTALAMTMMKEAADVKKEAFSAAELVLGTECGGSCAYSGISANPALGVVSDLLIDAGGTVILAETPELIGAEHLLAARAASPEIARRCLATIQGFEDEVKKMGVDMRGSNPSPGNIASGLTTIEEKSLGCIYKSGSRPLRDVIGYGQPVRDKGLVLMDTPGHDVEQLTGMVAGGCQVVIFTTGRGTPTGSPIVPTIKVSSNTALAQRMQENIDFNAGMIVSGEETVQQVGQRLLQEMLAVASGRLTQAEILGANDFALKRIGPST